MLALFLLLLRIVNSPFGRVLQAIRENDFRAEAIGYRVVVFRTLSNVLAALFATVAGALLALWLRYTGPDTTLSFEIMLDILLIVVIGGMGSLYGAVIGSVLFVLAQNYLQALLRLGAGSFDGVPLLVAAGLAGPLAALARAAVRACRSITFPPAWWVVSGLLGDRAEPARCHANCLFLPVQRKNWRRR